MKKRYTTAQTLWRWPGDMGWHFITLDKALSKEIRTHAHTYGAGFVKIRATVGATVWDTALFPHTQSQAYLIAIKTAVRKKEGLFEGDRVSVSFVLV